MKAIGFDFDHTLGVDNSLERKAFGLLAEALGAPIDITEPNEGELIERLLVPFRLAETSMAEMVDRFVRSLPPTARAHALDANALADRYRTLCYSLVDTLVQPIDGARACIDTLVADGWRVGILTNGWSPLQERKIARALGTFPGPILVSDAIGAYKPSNDAFVALERALECDAADLWYVGDNPLTDIAGARAYGVRAIWVSPNGAPYPDGVAEPTVRIESIGELPAVVRGS